MSKTILIAFVTYSTLLLATYLAFSYIPAQAPDCGQLSALVWAILLYRFVNLPVTFYARHVLSDKRKLAQFIESYLDVDDRQRKRYAIIMLSILFGERFGSYSTARRYTFQVAALWSDWLKSHFEYIEWEPSIGRYRVVS